MRLKHGAMALCFAASAFAVTMSAGSPALAAPPVAAKVANNCYVTTSPMAAVYQAPHGRIIGGVPTGSSFLSNELNEAGFKFGYVKALDVQAWIVQSDLTPGGGC